MKTIPYRCDESRHKALLGAAKASGTSVQRLFDNFVTHVLAERQLEARFVRGVRHKFLTFNHATHAFKSIKNKNLHRILTHLFWRRFRSVIAMSC